MVLLKHSPHVISPPPTHKLLESLVRLFHNLVVLIFFLCRIGGGPQENGGRGRANVQKD